MSHGRHARKSARTTGRIPAVFAAVATVQVLGAGIASAATCPSEGGDTKAAGNTPRASVPEFPDFMPLSDELNMLPGALNNTDGLPVVGSLPLGGGGQGGLPVVDSLPLDSLPLNARSLPVVDSLPLGGGGQGGLPVVGGLL
jgi:hypothetical protein